VTGGQAVVFVDAAVTRHVVRGQQLVVVEACSRRIAGGSVRVGQERNAEVVERVGSMRNVDEELVACTQGADGGRANRRQWVTFYEHVVRSLGQAVRAEPDDKLGEAIRA